MSKDGKNVTTGTVDEFSKTTLKEMKKELNEQQLLSNMQELLNKMKTKTISSTELGALAIAALKVGLSCEDFLKRFGLYKSPTEPKKASILREHCKAILSIITVEVSMALQNEKEKHANTQQPKE